MLHFRSGMLSSSKLLRMFDCVLKTRVVIIVILTIGGTVGEMGDYCLVFFGHFSPSTGPPTGLSCAVLVSGCRGDDR